MRASLRSQSSRITDSSRPSSRKLSPTNRQHKFAFFTDRDLGKSVPDALEQAGYLVERHAAHFAPDARDVDFLPVVGRHLDWIVPTHDTRQRYNPDERDAVMRSGVPLFIHVGQMKHGDLAASFVMQAPRLIRFREKHPPPFIAKVYRPERKSPFLTVPGAIKMVLTLDEWRADRR